MARVSCRSFEQCRHQKFFTYCQTTAKKPPPKTIAVCCAGLLPCLRSGSICLQASGRQLVVDICEYEGVSADFCSVPRDYRLKSAPTGDLSLFVVVIFEILLYLKSMVICMATGGDRTILCVEPVPSCGCGRFWQPLLTDSPSECGQAQAGGDANPRNREKITLSRRGYEGMAICSI